MYTSMYNFLLLSFDVFFLFSSHISMAVFEGGSFSSRAPPFSFPALPFRTPTTPYY